MTREGYQLTGQKIQGYTISKPIGQGKFSIVYRAQNEQGIPFALKKIKIFDMADQRQRQKCLKEVDIMKKLNHPHIIQYIDSFIHNNQLIIVTEWAEKGDLKKLIKEKEGEDLLFDQGVVWEYMKQISSALKHMHEKRIMHRDLKPANIFISGDQTLKIGDLGLGRSFSSQTLQAYSKVGTPLYMSPQLIQDSGYNQNADVWSLGCICYQLAELKSPFRNKDQKMSLMDLFQNITKCNYRPIQSKYSDNLRHAIENMIVVDPTKRWGSDQVYNFAVKCLEDVHRPLLDPFIAMDDILIKLQLLNYDKTFCKFAEKKPIHKLYFAIAEKSKEQHEQLNYFLQLCYWVMGLSNNSRGDKLPVYSKTLIDWSSPENSCRKLLKDVSENGVRLARSIYDDKQEKGYGESVCYLLNQLLIRELIRMKFQFRPHSESTTNLTHEEVQDNSKRQRQKQIQEQQRSQQESLQEESQFQQSILFNKNNRRDRNLDGLIDKIEEIQEEENKMMIVGRADEQEWRGECLRLEKKLADISQGAKQARRKNSYSNVETARLSQAKLTDLSRFIKPVTTELFNKINKDLQIIIKGEKRITQAFASTAQQFSLRNSEVKQMNNHASLLAQTIKERSTLLQKTVDRLGELEEKIKVATSDQSEIQKLKGLKTAIKNIKQEMKGMDQKRQILSHQLRKHMLLKKGTKQDYLQINYFDDAI